MEKQKGMKLLGKLLGQVDHAHAHTQKHENAHIHANKHTHTCTHAYTHTHTRILQACRHALWVQLNAVGEVLHCLLELLAGKGAIAGLLLRCSPCLAKLRARATGEGACTHSSTLCLWPVSRVAVHEPQRLRTCMLAP